MIWLAAGALVWTVIATPLAIVFGRSIRLADERELYR